MASLQHIRDFLGLRRSIVGLLGMVVLVGLGEKMAEQFLPVYIQALGGSAIAIGLFNGLNNLLGAFYSLPGAYLAERFGTKRALLVFNLLAMAGFAIVILIPAWQAVIVGSCFFLSWTAISLPATMGLVSRTLLPTQRTMGVSLHSLVRRFPMAVGPIVGGWFILHWGTQTGVRLAFVVALLLAAVAMVLQQTLIQPDPARNGATAAATRHALAHPLGFLRTLHPALRNLLVSDILIRFCEQIPYAFVVIWAMERVTHPVSAPEFGVLRAVEMTTAALIYLPVAYYADRTAKKPFVLLTFVFFTLFPLALLFCQSFWLLTAAFVLRGLKEFGDATRKALIMDLAPEDRKAMTFGVYYLVRDSIVAVAAFGGAYLWQISPQTNFLAAFAFGVLGTIWFALRGRDLSVAPASRRW